MIDVLHAHFADACNGVAFRITERPVYQSAIQSSQCRLLDGSTPVDGTPVICGTCGRLVASAELEPAGGYADPAT